MAKESVGSVVRSVLPEGVWTPGSSKVYQDKSYSKTRIKTRYKFDWIDMTDYDVEMYERHLNRGVYSGPRRKASNAKRKQIKNNAAALEAAIMAAFLDTNINGIKEVKVWFGTICVYREEPISIVKG